MKRLLIGLLILTVLLVGCSDPTKTEVIETYKITSRVIGVKTGLDSEEPSLHVYLESGEAYRLPSDYQVFVGNTYTFTVQVLRSRGPGILVPVPDKVIDYTLVEEE